MPATNPALEHFIRSIPLFSLIEPQDMQEVLRLLMPVELQAGEVLFREQEPGRAMWVLGEGTEVSVTSSQDGKRRPVVVGYARQGDVVGEMALVDDGPRSGTAIVVQGGHAHRIDAQEFHAMRATFVPAAFKILRTVCLGLCQRLRQTTDRIVAQGSQHIEAPRLPFGPHPDADLLQKFPAFRGLPSVVRLALAQKLEVVRVEEVTPIFAEGEPSDGAWFILDGEVSVGRNGKTLTNMPAGTMFGVIACIDNGPRSASCVTTGAATLLRMLGRDFDQLFLSGHRFAFQMVDLVARQLVQHLRDANVMLPFPGKGSGPAPTATPIPTMLHAPAGVADLDVLPHEIEVEAALPIELELDLGEFTPESEVLGA